MPKTSKLNTDYFLCRITMARCKQQFSNPEDFKQEIEKFVKANATKYAICFETGKKSGEYHTHFFLEDCKIQKKSFANKIGEHFGTGNQVFSTKKVDSLINTIAYLLKEDKNVIHTYDHDIIEQANLRLAEYKQEIATKQKAKKKQTIKAYIDSYLQALRDSTGNDRGYCIEDIVEATMRYYQENDLLIRRFQMEAQIATYCCEYVEGFREGIERSLVDAMKKYSTPNLTATRVQWGGTDPFDYMDRGNARISKKQD